MAIKKENLETVARLITALQQRHEQVLNLTNMLSQNTVWRSPTGDIEIKLSDADKEQLTAALRGYVEESEIILNTLRGYLPDVL